MIIQPFRKMAIEDFPGAPDWFQKLPQSLNQPLSSINIALQGNMTFGDNIASEDFSATFTHNVPTTIQLRRLQIRPMIVLPGYANGSIVTACSITKYYSNNKMDVTVLFNGAPTTPITMTVRFLP